MKYQLLVCSVIVFIILLISEVTIQAREQVIDLTVCVAGTCDNFAEATSWEAKSCESRGIGWSNIDYNHLKLFQYLIEGMY